MQLKFTDTERSFAFVRHWCLPLIGGVMFLAMSTGCEAQAPAVKKHAEHADQRDSDGSKSSAAQDALERIFRAYEADDMAAIEASLDPAAPDLKSVLESARESQNQQKQIRISIKDVQVSVNPDFAFVQVNWEKRFLALPDMKPKLVTGHATFAMNRGAGEWRLAGINGDNIFAALTR